MLKKSRAKPKSGASGGGPSRPFQGNAKAAKSSGMKAGTFARQREGVDLVAFGTASGSNSSVRLYAEALETFQRQQQTPRNFLLILAQSPDSDQFEAYQTPYDRVEPLMFQVKLVKGERPYWPFRFEKNGRRLMTADGTHTELRKVEKRPTGSRP